MKASLEVRNVTREFLTPIVADCFYTQPLGKLASGQRQIIDRATDMLLAVTNRVADEATREADAAREAGFQDGFETGRLAGEESGKWREYPDQTADDVLQMEARLDRLISAQPLDDRD